MARLPPDHRALAVLAAVQAQAPYADPDPRARALHSCLTTDASDLPEVAEALALYGTPHHRHALNAALLAKAPDALLTDALDMGAATPGVYRYLFFDRGVFPHAFAVFDYVRELALTDQERAYYAKALQEGPEHLLHRFRIGKRPDLDPRVVLRSLLAEQFDRAQAHRGQEITSEVAQAALTWGREAAKTAHLLISSGDQQTENAMRDIRIALKITNTTKTLAELNVAPDDLVTE